MADTLSTLETIRNSIRRITKSLTNTQLTDANINDYINTFVLYDMPSSVCLSSLLTNLTFYTSPYTDVYKTNTDDEDDPLYNFKDKYSSIQNPVYIDGSLGYLTTNQTEFYSQYPKTSVVETVGTGDGLVVNYTGTLSKYPVLKGGLYFSSSNTSYTKMVAFDDGDGNIDGDVTESGDIDNVTGEYDFTFDLTPADGTAIEASYIPYTPTNPTMILYFQNEFTLRPIPDKSYKIDITVQVRPSELTNNDDVPELSQWRDYIALGASKKIFRDRLQLDKLASIEPLFQEQELLVLRRTGKQNSKKYISTIYDGYLKDPYGKSNLF